MADSTQSGLVLSGGGARGAYQAGALRALYEIASEQKKLDVFKVITGVSAGAINATFLASHAENWGEATERLTNLWRNLTAKKVFDTDYSSMARNTYRLMKGLSLGGLNYKLSTNSIALLDPSPLKQLLSHEINFRKIKKNIDQQKLRAVSVTATDYSTSKGVTFVQSSDSIALWRRSRRLALRDTLNIDHVMASSAIPLFFPPVSINQRYYGDGCVRNTAPLSPSIHLGAEKIFVIGVRAPIKSAFETIPSMRPTWGRILSVLINSIFMDSIESDMERLNFINETLHSTHTPSHNSVKKIEVCFIHPSKDVAEMARDHLEELPRLIKYLFGGLGSPEETADLVSYLLFEPRYCSELVQLGYDDTMNSKNQILQFL